MEGRNLLVLYGSQTGTAEEVAERIGREGKRRHFRVRVSAMDEFDVVSIQVSACCAAMSLLLFLINVSGKGEELASVRVYAFARTCSSRVRARTVLYKRTHAPIILYGCACTVFSCMCGQRSGPVSSASFVEL